MQLVLACVQEPDDGASDISIDIDIFDDEDDEGFREKLVVQGSPVCQRLALLTSVAGKSTSEIPGHKTRRRARLGS